MENQNVVVTPSVSNVSEILTMLDSARNGLIKGINKTGELVANYGKALEGAFNQTLANGDVVKWFDLKGKAKAGIKQERAKFVMDMEQAGYGKGTIDVYWQRVKESCGYQTAGNKVKAESTVDDKNLKDLQTIINRIYADQEAGGEPKSAEILEDLKFCFSFLGGDVDTLG